MKKLGDLRACCNRCPELQYCNDGKGCKVGQECMHANADFECLREDEEAGV